MRRSGSGGVRGGSPGFVSREVVVNSEGRPVDLVGMDPVQPVPPSLPSNPVGVLSSDAARDVIDRAWTNVRDRLSTSTGIVSVIAEVDAWHQGEFHKSWFLAMASAAASHGQFVPNWNALRESIRIAGGWPVPIVKPMCLWWSCWPYHYATSPTHGVPTVAGHGIFPSSAAAHAFGKRIMVWASDLGSKGDDLVRHDRLELGY